MAAVAAVAQANLRYARLLDWGTRIGLALLLLSFFAYVTGLMPAHVPLDRLPELWQLPLQRYIELTDTAVGWHWVTRLHHGDVLGLAGIAVLAGCSGVCVLSLLPLYRRNADHAYLGLGLAQVAVLLLAASGWLDAGS